MFTEAEKKYVSIFACLLKKERKKYLIRHSYKKKWRIP